MKKIIEEFGLKVLKTVVPVVCNIPVQITQTEIDLNTTSDACFRSCLALIRSVILFHKKCNKQRSMIKGIPVADGLTNKENHQPEWNESMSGGIHKTIRHTLVTMVKLFAVVMLVLYAYFLL